MEMEYENVVTLTDDNGDEIGFEVLDIVPYEGKDYVVLLPVDDDSDEPEAVILQILPSSGDPDVEDELRGIEDEAVLNAVFELFLQRGEQDDAEQ